jgi:NADH:ubiquinone oxidoreductase subunit C
MTRQLSGADVAQRLAGSVPGAALSWSDDEVRVAPESLVAACRFLKESPDLAMDYLTAVTAVDYVERFEVVYHMMSLSLNHSVVLKTDVFGRDDVAVPSVVEVWQGADLQEREVWDLMGVRFTGHPNMKRILTWEGFEGHPLRRDNLGG